MSDSKKKGNLLEDLVAVLHRVPGVDVDVRVPVPVLDPDSDDTREIDVLLSSTCAGYPLRFAIECKNWSDPVGVETLDAFIGKLADVGIPKIHGIVVSAVGYTAQAMRRAKKEGIRVLQFEGLAPDRLAQIVHEAYQSIVYVTLTWQRMSHLPALPGSASAGPSGAISAISELKDHENTQQWAIRAVWECWTRGQIPLDIGEVTIAVREHEEAIGPAGLVIVDAVKHAHVFTASGELRISSLLNAATKAMEKTRLDTTFDPDSIAVERIVSEEALQEHARKGSLHLLLGRVRVPRLELEQMWYPPSLRAIARFKELREAGKDLTFEAIEGLDIRRAWDEPVSREDFES